MHTSQVFCSWLTYPVGWDLKGHRKTTPRLDKSSMLRLDSEQSLEWAQRPCEQSHIKRMHHDTVYHIHWINI
jgi:hypothetical protein